MIKEELDKITLDAVQTALEEVGFDVRRMEKCVITEEGRELYALIRSFRHDPSAQITLKLF